MSLSLLFPRLTAGDRQVILVGFSRHALVGFNAHQCRMTNQAGSFGSCAGSRRRPLPCLHLILLARFSRAPRGERKVGSPSLKVSVMSAVLPSHCGLEIFSTLGFPWDALWARLWESFRWLPFGDSPFGAFSPCALEFLPGAVSAPFRRVRKSRESCSLGRSPR